MTYPEALRYLDSFIDHEKDAVYTYSAFKLERMKRLAALLGDPQEGAKSIHVAGTKGKGSTAAIIQSILKEAGYKAGLYTSPHLVSFRERIRIGNELIGEDDIAQLLGRMKGAIDVLKGEQRPSFFEVYTALALLYFREKDADVAVYETGLGGRLDATNIIEPLVSVITPISYEHMDKLGNTLREIASEKAGIVKHGVPCVSSPQEEEALSAIEGICRERHAPFTLAGRDIEFKGSSSGEDGEIFDVRTRSAGYPGLRTRLLGYHQVVNAATAVGAIEAMVSQGMAVSREAVRKGIEAARWDGRIQVIGKKPLIVLDGAQNRASARALADSVKRIFGFRKLVLVIGISKDKDMAGIMDELLPISDSVILTRSSARDRAAEPSKIMEFMKGRDAVETMSVEEGMDIAKRQASPDDLILVTGSLFVVGDVLGKMHGAK